MDFEATEEQRLLLSSLRTFIERELAPYEDEAERRRGLLPEQVKAIRAKAKDAGFYAMHMPPDVGGGGVDYLTQTLCTKELGRVSNAVSWPIHGPTHILLGCKGVQRERWLMPGMRGERVECFALTEPGAGSDARGIQTRAVRDGAGWVINGRKHFISNADQADFIILFAVTGTDQTARGPRNRITAFLVDKDTPGVESRVMRAVVDRGYNPNEITFNDVRVGDDQILGEEGKGFDFANDWLYAGRIAMGAFSVGRAERALELSLDWAATRKQFGQTIGRFQGISFKIADMATELRAAELMVLHAAWLLDQGRCTRADASMAKLFATEMVGRVTDQAVQIFGGMGLMEDMPIERLWRDARVERIWEGTSKIQRDIIGRDLLRPRER
jgi:acyl-CoA dehydrogenase